MHNWGGPKLRIILSTTNDNCEMGNTVGGNLTKVSSAKKQTKKKLCLICIANEFTKS